MGGRLMPVEPRRDGAGSAKTANDEPSQRHGKDDQLNLTGPYI